ncbi:AraC family transcriptional regulator [Paenibacillus sp. XY044]|uniref:AraC family transcriptional regulator n=1 Tax=Paenibacillus sp. XY044 TaxID=2026089 RepID=UPI000B987F25|nr:AraC family transcriptional regulator [Paenibacillus sp. XY044]OZB96707.1 AraC family transcriptional regulator [Paenibacillus sp. XY044]
MRNSSNHADSLIPYQEELSRFIENYANGDGVHETPIPSLALIRSSKTTFPSFSVHEPALCIVSQGSKVVMLADESFTYGPSSYLVVSLDLPVSAQIIEATPEVPYLCFRLKFNPKDALDLLNQANPASRTKQRSKRGLFVEQTSAPLLDAAVRLVRLLDNPQDVPVLAPLIVREILYRVLQGAQGDVLRQIALSGSSSNRIAGVVEQLKRNYMEPLRIDELAAAAHMAPSSLHRHFKEVTAMSPLQYQKQLRLQEARRLLLSESADAADVAFRVGYESPSQFSSEYARLFGLPPISDITRLREQLGRVL